MAGTTKTSVYGKLPSFKLGRNSNSYVIVFMGTIMVLDGKTTFNSESHARRALSFSVSNEYNANEAIRKKFSTVGKFREDLEKKKIIQIVPETKVIFTATVSAI